MDMVITKERSVLTFTKGNGDVATYDLKDGTMKTIRNGKEKVMKSLTHFFANMNKYDLYKCFEDKKYANFIQSVAMNNYKCKNMETFLKRLKQYAHFENYELMGIKYDSNIRKATTDYPKDIIKIIRKNDLYVEKYFEDKYDYHTELVQNCLRYADKHDNIDIKEVYDFVRGYRSQFYNFEELINDKKYNYEYKRLMDYIFDYLPNQEGLSHNSGLRVLRDYAKMQVDMSRNGKFNKYPKYLHTMHDIASKNYQVYKAEYEEEIFAKKINLDLEYKNDTDRYVIVAPKCTDDVKQEGVQLSHCVASYISNILEDRCQIMFLRLKGKEKESLVTFEIVKDRLVQAKGNMNRNIYDEERLFLEKYCKVNKLNMRI